MAKSESRQKGGRDGKLQTVRREPVSASLLAEFLEQRRKVEEQEATIARQQSQIDALSAALQKVRTASIEQTRTANGFERSVKLLSATAL